MSLRLGIVERLARGDRPAAGARERPVRRAVCDVGLREAVRASILLGSVLLLLLLVGIVRRLLLLVTLVVRLLLLLRLLLVRVLRRSAKAAVRWSSARLRPE